VAANDFVAVTRPIDLAADCITGGSADNGANWATNDCTGDGATNEPGGLAIGCKRRWGKGAECNYSDGDDYLFHLLIFLCEAAVTQPLAETIVPE